MTRRQPKLETLAAFKRQLKGVPDESLDTFVFIHRILASMAYDRGDAQRCAAIGRRIGLIEGRMRKSKEPSHV